MRMSFGASAVVALVAVALAGCDRPANSGGPQTFSFSPTASTGSATALIEPASLPVIPTPIFACPGSAPLTTSLNLIVSAPTTTLLLNEIALQVFDVNHVGAPPTVLTGSSLTGMFGSPSVPAGTTRTFAFSPQFGCGLAAPAALTATLVLAGAGTPPLTVTVPFAR